ncbi:MAG: hypothetical protein CMM99_05705 [Rickettsiales bacterium]|nr:hypothetical protein [Rickettsiales bacterium]
MKPKSRSAFFTSNAVLDEAMATEINVAIDRVTFIVKTAVADGFSHFVQIRQVDRFAVEIKDTNNVTH